MRAHGTMHKQQLQGASFTAQCDSPGEYSIFYYGASFPKQLVALGGFALAQLGKLFKGVFLEKQKQLLR